MLNGFKYWAANACQVSTNSGRANWRHAHSPPQLVHIDVRIGGKAELDVFSAMHEATARRLQFTPLSRTHLRQQWEFLSPLGWLQLFIAYDQHRPIAGVWHTVFGDRVTARVAGWTGEATKLRPNIACYWSAIQWAKDNGYHYYDFGGVERQFAEMLLANQAVPREHLQSPEAFKYYFGGDLVLLPVPRQLTLNRIARAAIRPVFTKLAEGPLRRFTNRFRNG